LKDDDGRKQGGKKIAARGSEFQKVNNFRVRFDFGHVMHSHSKLSKSTNKIKFVEIFHQLHEEPFTAKTEKGVCISGCVYTSRRGIQVLGLFGRLFDGASRVGVWSQKPETERSWLGFGRAT
jgi:hypothetical protein